MNAQLMVAALEALVEKQLAQLSDIAQENRRIQKLLDDGIAKLQKDECKLGKHRVDQLVEYFQPQKDKKDNEKV